MLKNKLIMKKNYVSNSEESVRMFKMGLFENLSKVHYSVPLFIFIPAILFFGYKSFENGISAIGFLFYFAIGQIGRAHV